MFQSIEHSALADIGAMFVAILIAIPCMIVAVMFVMWRFRRHLDRAMSSSAGASEPVPQAAAIPGGRQAGITLDIVQATRETAIRRKAHPLIQAGQARTRRLQMIFAGAAGTYALVVAIFMTQQIASPELGPWKVMLLGCIFFLPNSVPIALSPTMVARRQPRYLVLAVALTALLMLAWQIFLPGEPFDLWLLMGALPALMFLLLNVRRLRAVGPIVFTATWIVVSGFSIALVHAVFNYFETVGPVHFVREDLAALPLPEASSVWLSELARMPPPEVQQTIKSFFGDPQSVFHVANPQAATAALDIQVKAIVIAATAVAVILAWLFVRWLAWRHRRRKASERMLAVDVLMTIIALPLAMVWATQNIWISVGILAGLLGYKLALNWLLSSRQKSMAVQDPRRLLMLRVFGKARESQRLLEDIEDRWRFLGPVRLLGAADLAHTIIEPDEFYAFLNRSLGDEFVKSKADIEQRLSQAAPRQDPDGTYRTEDFYCHADTWQMAMSELAHHADSVFMDLRGFDSSNQGCVFEIEQLVATVPLGRIVLLVDEASDLPYLQQVLDEAALKLPAESPNAMPGNQRIRVLRAASRYGHTLNALMAMLCDNIDT